MASGSWKSPDKSSNIKSPKRVSLYNKSGEYNSSSREISLRQELADLFHGTAQEISKKRPLLLRIMRRDDNGDRTPCECVDSITREPDQETYCPICLGEGYKWDEEWSAGYRWIQQPREVLHEAGLSQFTVIHYFLEYDEDLTNGDKIVEVKLDKAGDVIEPVKRHAIYKIQHPESFRLDNARIEFIKTWCYEKDVKFLND